MYDYVTSTNINNNINVATYRLPYFLSLFFFRSTVSVTMLNVSFSRQLYLPQSLFAVGRIDWVNGIGHRNTEPFPISHHKKKKGL